MNKMSFVEFKNEIVEKILDFLPESFNGSEVSLNVVTKPNDVSLTGLTIRKAGSRVAPTIYLEEYYSQIESGDNIGVVMRRIADVRMAHEIEDIDFESFFNYENCKDKILPRLYGYEMNNQLIEHRAYTRIGDFIVIYSVDLGPSDEGRMSVPVDNSILERWNISIEELHNVAVKNQHNVSKGTFMGMSQMMRKIMVPEILEDMDCEDDSLSEMLLPEEDEKMFVISNTRGINGASMILDEEFMNSVCDVVGDSFYILPSSIHEVLAVKDEELMDVMDMAAMVYEINRMQVSPEERLSDHVYRYTRDAGITRAA
ncbi:hypothetical protein SAMN06297422_10722 [Lachnospiraceae bacterium]|nr:hypothetical protein SAMN06297422_10722 [Lachnospiraceae bacterium]